LTIRLILIRLVYMNDTNLTPRQKLVLNIINANSGILREQIQKELSKTHKISKPTLIRDLNYLLGQKLIMVKGKGKNTKYFSFSKNPLLRVFDVDQYFSKEPDQRTGAKQSFNFEVYKNLNKLFTDLEQKKINRVKKSFSNQVEKLQPDILKRELERFVIELSWKSSKIEGNTYTLLETEELIKKNKQARDKSAREAVMILNHKKAFEEILKNRTDFKKLNLSKINQLHNILVKDLEISVGIRNRAVGITGTVYKPLDNQFQLREAMEKFIKVANKENNFLQKALIGKAMISYIQPYTDGNKRTGRMLCNALLLAGDYYPLSYRSIDEKEFKKALIIFYEQNSIYQLKRLFIEQLIFAYKNYFK